jgi:hypothetical protein
MALSSIRDVVEAVDAGRTHTQRFYKAAGLAGDTYWQDWAYSTGQPGVNARVGDGGALTPFVANANKAIWFPDTGAGQERRLLELVVTTIAGGTNQAMCSLLLYDLLAVYPLIDGDSTDAQIMDNTEVLPRYADGREVTSVLVNHVAAQTGVGTGVYSVVGCDGNTYNDIPFGVANVGLGKAAATGTQASNASIGNLFMPRSNCGGVRQVNSIQFVTPPSGLWAIYLIKPLVWITNDDGMLVTTKTSTEKNLLVNNSLHMPRVYDGAHLGLFYMANGGARSVAISGHATFVWG